MFKELSQPEYLHLLLNPLVTHGLPLAVMALGIGMLARNRCTQVTALVLVALSSAAARLVIRYGHQAYDRVYAMSYGDAQQWLVLHAHRAEKVEWAFSVTAVVAVLSAVLPWRWARLRMPLTTLALVLAIGAMAAGGWIAYAGGKVRHSELRDGPPPVKVESRDDHQDHEH